MRIRAISAKFVHRARARGAVMPEALVVIPVLLACLFAMIFSAQARHKKMGAQAEVRAKAFLYAANACQGDLNSDNEGDFDSLTGSDTSADGSVEAPDGYPNGQKVTVPQAVDDMNASKRFNIVHVSATEHLNVGPKNPSSAPDANLYRYSADLPVKSRVTCNQKAYTGVTAVFGFMKDTLNNYIGDLIRIVPWEDILRKIVCKSIATTFFPGGLVLGQLVVALAPGGVCK